MPHLNVGTIGRKRDAALFAKIFSAVENAGSPSSEVETNKTTKESMPEEKTTAKSSFVIKPWMRNWAERHSQGDPKD